MACDFEFDPVNRILLARVRGCLTDELMRQAYRLIGVHAAATDPQFGIFDMSAVTEVQLTAETMHALARQQPAMPHGMERPRVVVAPSEVAFGFARMFQAVGEQTRSRLMVVRSLEEAYAALGVQSPQFEPLDQRGSH